MSHHYIRFTDVHFSYPDGFEALRGVSFLLTHGERVALLGRNGAGKSTLLLLTNGLLLPSRGEVNIGDVPVGKKTLPIVRQSVGMVFQNPDDQLFMPTVEEDVAFGPLNMKLPPEEVERRVGMALDAVGASDLRKRSAMQLSGGQRRRVAIATVLSMEPSILVLDEPTSNLDFSARRELIEVLKDFTHTQLIATHDLDMVRELCPRSIVIDKGRIVADGETTAILEDQKVLEILGIS
ncbi:MAG: energy-coupling factor ABC transporter ATP-binding protein [Muribaculaceae bacterium]|nr:energy-coupling factor ABC transporter ATP-binding protein [Muribaculaceae bacterium]